MSAVPATDFQNIIYSLNGGMREKIAAPSCAGLQNRQSRHMPRALKPREAPPQPKKITEIKKTN